MSLEPGTRIGPYEILSPLGAGGMGEVYRGRDTRLDRYVAVKVLSQELAETSRGRERFEREARAISKLSSHPHICTVYDVQLDGKERAFLVLELLEGETLEERLARGRLSLEETVTYAIEITDALTAAHGEGIIHRDLKPSNIMITRSGVKLLDFGLAQLRIPQNRANSQVDTASEAALTSAGMVLGTLPYMSPEQVAGQQLDSRSDIFSFGSVLYQMLTGQRPFADRPGRSVAAQILSDDPQPVSDLAPTVSPELARIVSLCLRKDPARRYQSIADVKVALEDVHDAVSTSPKATVGTAPLWRWAWVILVLIAVTVGYFAITSRDRPEAPLPHVEPLTTLQGEEASPTFAPDGEQVAFTWSGPNHDNDDIYIQRIGSGSEMRRTVDQARDFSPAWSPDGRWIAFLRGDVPGRSDLILIPPLGGPERPLSEIHIRQSYIYPPYLSWFADSSALVVVDSPAPGKAEGLFVISLDTGHKQALTTPPPSTYADMAPAVSPDGHAVVFSRGTALFLLPLHQDGTASPEPTVLVESQGQALGATWTSDGRAIVYSAGGSLWKVQSSGRPQPTRLAWGGQDAYMPVLSRSTADKPARLIYVRSTADPNIWRVDLPAVGTPTRETPVLSIASTMLDANPQFSPDGKRVAFQSTRSGFMEIWVADTDGKNAAPLTAMKASTTGTPRWSPDGNTIAFDSNAEGQYEVYTVSAAGGKPSRVTLEPGADHVPSFSRDGAFLYFSSNRSGAFEIWKTPVSGGTATQVTHNGGFVPFESFDGDYVYYTQTATGSSPLWRIPTAGGEPHKVVDRVTERAFAVLDQGIYYVEREEQGAWPWGLVTGLGFLRSDRSRLRFFDFSQMTSKTIADLGERVALGLGASPDGRTVLFTRVDNASTDLMLVADFR